MKDKIIYQSLVDGRQAGQKKLAVLLDPDNGSEAVVQRLVYLAVKAKVDYFFVGGSLVTNATIGNWIQHIKTLCNIPVIIFPGSVFQVSPQADGFRMGVGAIKKGKKDFSPKITQRIFVFCFFIVL